MDPTLVVMAVRAAVRLGRAGQEAIGQHARDRSVLLPLVDRIAFPDKTRIIGAFALQPTLITERLRPYWESLNGTNGAPRLAGDFDVLAAEYARLQAQKAGQGKPQADDVAGVWMITQWAKGAGPIGPIARMTLTIVDVAAEFAAHDPRLFGVDGNAELLVKALATRIADLVPDDADDMGPRNVLGQRLTGIFLKAALGALSEHPDALIEEEHLQSLVRSTLPRLIDALPGGADQVQWRSVVEALLGPVAAEAMKVVAANPQAFFGRKFEDDDLLGALTRAYLLKTAEVGLGEIFTRTGAVQLYKATVQLAAQRPELFVGKPADVTEKLVASVFRDLAVALDRSTPPLDEQVIAHLAATAIETVAREGSAYLDPAKPWHTVLSATLTPVVTAVAESLRQGGSMPLRRLAEPAQLHDMVRIIVAQVARTPGMITSSDNAEINRLVSAVTGAMARDRDGLLSHGDWMAILAAAAEEVASNPGRLINIGESAASDLLETLLDDLVVVAAEQWKTHGRSGGSVLFGPTLREAVLVAIRSASGQAAAARLNVARLKELAATLTQLVAAKAGKYGSKEWLRVYRALIAQVLESGQLPQLDEAAVNLILSHGATP